MALMALGAAAAHAQGGHPQPPPPPAGAKAAKCKGRPVPQLEDVTAKTGITFKHAADPAKTYIVESMSGGVIVFDYDRDGWPDIYFTNAPTVEMAIKSAIPTVIMAWGLVWSGFVELISAALSGPSRSLAIHRQDVVRCTASATFQ